jgi:small subunit ribosomal protein S6e
MAFKLNITDKGKSWKIDSEGDFIVGKSIGEKIDGKEINADLNGYELEISGGSDIAGFPLSKNVEGIGLKRVLKTKGWGMWDSKKGIRRRKTVRGKTISEKTVQINIKVLKEGGKNLSEVFPDQNVTKVEEGVELAEASASDTQTKEDKATVVKVEEKVEDKKEEGKLEAKNEAANEEKVEEKIEEIIEDKIEEKIVSELESEKAENSGEKKKDMKKEDSKKEDNIKEKKD